MSLRIWLNRNFATTVHLAAALHGNPDGCPVELYGSHVDPSAPLLAAVDRVVREPEAGPRYVDQALDFCRQHRIDVFLPVAEQLAVARRRADFAAVGTAVIAPPAAAVALLGDKGATYRVLAGSDLVPPWATGRGVVDFDQALQALDVWWDEENPLVVKPARGSGAQGVRFLHRRPVGLAELLGPLGADVPADTYRSALAAAGRTPELLVTPYFPGPETSVDVLAHEGRAVAAVPRTKAGRVRVVEGPAAVLEHTEALVQRFGLDGLVNVQFRTFAGRPVLLEINTRPAGGVHQAELAGVNLVWGAVRQALGKPADVGPVRLGARYVLVDATVQLPGR